ncbi:MAG: vWA domain-containing protein, partial [Rhodothermales bacterium]|nr:vWA domain-containing protein [Rhodothermales bacterium]
MDLSFGLTPVLLILCVVVAATASYLTYRGTTPVLTTGRRAVLSGLRLTSLAAILFLLFEPVLSRFTVVTEDPVLAVLIDASESMQLPAPDAGGVTPADQAVDLAHQLASQRTPAVRFFTFAGQIDETIPETEPLDSLDFRGQRTDIAASIEEVRSRLDASNLGGILVLSDGRFTSGRNPRHAAEASDVPIYTVVLGDSAQKRDVRISRVTTNEMMYSGVTLPVDVAISSTGFGGARLAVTLSVDDSTAATAVLQAPPDGTEQTVNLSLTPSTPGLKQVVVRVETRQWRYADLGLHVRAERRAPAVPGALAQVVEESLEARVARV